MVCPNCGGQSPAAALHCVHCGTRLPEASAHPCSLYVFAGIGAIGLAMLIAGIGMFLAETWPITRASEIAAVPTEAVESRTHSAPTATPRPSAPVALTFTLTPALTPTPALGFGGPDQVAFAYGTEENVDIYVSSLINFQPVAVTSDTYRDEAPTWSPDGQRLAFVSAHAVGDWEIYVFDLTSGATTQISRLPTMAARFPQWSPVMGDDRVVFEGRQDGVTNIWMIRADGTGLEQITNSGADSRPSWSPDGTQLVFGRATADTDRNGRVTTSDRLDLFVLDLASGVARNLTNTPGEDEHSFAWSRDGEWIAFCRVSGDTNGDGYFNLDDQSDLFVMRSSGGGEANLTQGRLSAFSPSWSPDSQRIIFTSYPTIKIWMVERDGSNLYPLTDTGPYLHPEWSP